MVERKIRLVGYVLGEAYLVGNFRWDDGPMNTNRGFADGSKSFNENKILLLLVARGGAVRRVCSQRLKPEQFAARDQAEAVYVLGESRQLRQLSRHGEGGHEGAFSLAARHDSSFDEGVERLDDRRSAQLVFNGEDILAGEQISGLQLLVEDERLKRIGELYVERWLPAPVFKFYSHNWWSSLSA